MANPQAEAEIKARANTEMSSQSDDDEEAENSGDFGYEMDDLEEDDGDDDGSGSDEPSIDEDALDDDNDHNNLLGYVLAIEPNFENGLCAGGEDCEQDDMCDINDVIE